MSYKKRREFISRKPSLMEVTVGRCMNVATNCKKSIGKSVRLSEKKKALRINMVFRYSVQLFFEIFSMQ
jgi:hypothetical protein